MKSKLATPSQRDALTPGKVELIVSGVGTIFIKNHAGTCMCIGHTNKPPIINAPALGHTILLDGVTNPRLLASSITLENDHE